MRVLYLAKNYMYINEDGRIIKSEIKKTKGVVTSSIGYKHIVNISFKLPKSINKEMLEIEAEKYVFTEASLNYDKEYKINYHFREYKDHYIVEAYIVDVEILKKEFEEHLKTFNHIDFISADPFVFKAYYTVTSDKPQNDVFICFSENEAYLSYFEKGEFVFVKSLSKLTTLSKELGLDVKETVSLLEQKGLDESLYENKEHYFVVENFFSHLFMKVNNLINYSINYYEVAKAERIFFYSPFKIKALFESYGDFWKLSATEFKPYKINTDYDYLEYTACVYNSKHYERENENFSVFPKPVPFYKKRSTVFIAFLLLVAAVLATDAYFKNRVIKKQENEISKLNAQIIKLKKEHSLVKMKLKKYQQDVLYLKEQNSALQKEIADISDKVLYLQTIQKQPLSTNELAYLVSVLKKHKLKLAGFEKKGSHVELLVISRFNNSSEVARMLKDLYRHGYKNVASSYINNNKGIYLSKVSYDE